jgi:hypothetical protein
MRGTNQIAWIVVHHSAANDIYTDIEDLKRHRIHSGLGYNFIVDDDDALRDSAKGNDRKFKASQDAPDTQISNGTYGINTNAWNICVDGNFEHQKPTEDELFAVVQVIASKARSWGWRQKDVSRIIGHYYAGKYLSRQRYGTACPGKNLISQLPDIRKRVAAYLPN